MILRGVSRAAGWLALLVLLAPLVYACWLSFTPDESLRAPMDDWSLRWYREFFRSARWNAALGNSLTVGAMAACFALLAGLPLALAAARLHFRGRALVTGAAALPLAVPPILLGIGLLPVVQALELWGTRAALALAHALLGMPVVFHLTRTALETVSPDLESAARGLGATAAGAARRVTLPLIGPSVLAGAVMAFVLSLNEFVLSLFLATPETETLPRVIWPNLRYTLSPLVAVASFVTTLATSAGIGTVLWLVWRRR
jgi:ABC-type spermidine/putrescine transport system permease subunit II